MRRDVTALCALLLAGGAPLAAQSDSTRPLDPAIERARTLADAGNAEISRRILDSLVNASSPDSPTYVDALYWRAVLATEGVDAERDFRRLLVEAPLSSRAEDAMLRLGQLEQARGDRRAASDHFQRFLLSYPDNPARARVAVSLVRLLFDQGQVSRGCAALRTARESIPPGSLELRNQVEFYAPRCVVLEAAPAAESTATDTAARAPARSAADDSAAKPVSAPRSTAGGASSFYSVQVAAYDSREPAIRMSRVLVSRGLEARVDGRARPFRVRVGKYATRAEAVRAATSLKSQGITGFVTLVRIGG